MDETALADATIETSIFALILQADLVVKLVMLILLASSLWCWAVVFEKTRKIRALRQSTDEFETAFWSGAPLAQLFQRFAATPTHPMAVMFVAAYEEWQEAPRSNSPEHDRNLLDRIAKVLSLTQDREISQLDKNISSLATIGAVAPFVGLFGTVWGIMNSFQSIALTKNTTLAVVAPGIAEALLATALGLLAAIPAVVAYNKISNSIDGLGDRFGSFAEELSVVISREIDSRKAAA